MGIYGALKPDQPAYLNDGLMICDGVYPVQNGYAPMRGFQPMNNGTAPARVIGAGAYRYLDTNYLFAGTATGIYLYTLAGYSSVLNGLSSNPGFGLHFCVSGKYMVATNGVDAIKKFDPASPSTMTNIGTGAPLARYLAQVGGFLVAGYAANNPLLVQWSDQGDPTKWSGGEASFYQLPGGGDITGVATSGAGGLVFQENCIRRFDYVGGDVIFNWAELATDIGCSAPQSLASYGRLNFFLSNKGFMACDGNEVQAIGEQEIDKTFQGLIDRSYLQSMRAVVDPVRSLYIVSVPSADPTNTVYIYHYGLRRWTTAQITLTGMFSSLAFGVDLDALGDMYPDLDAMTISLDSAAFQGGYPALMVFDANNTLGTLEGETLAATFVDGLRQPIPNRVARIRWARPATDAKNVTFTVLGRRRIGDTPTPASYTALTAGGYIRMRQAWNLIQTQQAIPAGEDWRFMQGYDLDAVAGGHA